MKVRVDRRQEFTSESFLCWSTASLCNLLSRQRQLRNWNLGHHTCLCGRARVRYVMRRATPHAWILYSSSIYHSEFSSDWLRLVCAPFIVLSWKKPACLMISFLSALCYTVQTVRSITATTLCEILMVNLSIFLLKKYFLLQWFITHGQIAKWNSLALFVFFPVWQDAVKCLHDWFRLICGTSQKFDAQHLGFVFSILD